jgi:hypothetical protein
MCCCAICGGELIYIAVCASVFISALPNRICPVPAPGTHFCLNRAVYVVTEVHPRERVVRTGEPDGQTERATRPTGSVEVTASSALVVSVSPGEVLSQVAIEAPVIKHGCPVEALCDDGTKDMGGQIKVECEARQQAEKRETDTET